MRSYRSTLYHRNNTVQHRYVIFEIESVHLNAPYNNIVVCYMEYVYKPTVSIIKASGISLHQYSLNCLRNSLPCD